MLTRLVTFLTQLRNRFNQQKVNVLSYFRREDTRYIAPDECRRMTTTAKRFFRNNCAQYHIQFWNLRGFTDSLIQILSVGVNLNRLGFDVSTYLLVWSFFLMIPCQTKRIFLVHSVKKIKHLKNRTWKNTVAQCEKTNKLLLEFAFWHGTYISPTTDFKLLGRRILNCKPDFTTFWNQKNSWHSSMGIL